MFQHFILSSNIEESLIWRGSQNDLFTVNSFYKWLEFGGFSNSEYKHIWASHIPLKIKVFLMAAKKRQTSYQNQFKGKGLAWGGNL